MNIEMLVTIGLLISVAILIISIFTAVAANRAATRDIGERVVERDKERIVKDVQIVSFPDKSPLDIDSYLSDLTEHIEQYGAKGKSAKDFLFFLYGEDFQQLWYRDSRKVWQHDDDNN